MFRTMADVKFKNKASGHHWFSPDTMRFFSSRVETGLLYGRYFVTSERFDDDFPRLYTVREVVGPNADIDTVGEFQAYETKLEAVQAIGKLASGTFCGCNSVGACEECADRADSMNTLEFAEQMWDRWARVANARLEENNRLRKAARDVLEAWGEHGQLDDNLEIVLDGLRDALGQ